MYGCMYVQDACISKYVCLCMYHIYIYIYILHIIYIYMYKCKHRGKPGESCHSWGIPRDPAWEFRGCSHPEQGIWASVKSLGTPIIGWLILNIYEHII